MSVLRRLPLRLFLLFAIAAGVAGCDKCGDFIFNRPGACKGGSGPG